MRVSNRNPWLLLLLIIVGIVIGGIIGDILGEEISFLQKSYSIGLTPPLQLDLSVIQLTFGFLIDVNVASVIGLIIAIIIFNKL